jgi:hypothetical protein
MRLTSRLTALAVAIGAFGIAAPVALALEETADPKAEYVAQAEPICKTNVLANKRIFQGVEKLVKEDKLKKAAPHFSRAAKAFAKTIDQLNAIPRPPEFNAKLTKWLGLLRTDKTIIEKIGRALKAEDKHKAESYSTELNRIASKANNTVLTFGFKYCRIEPSRFR